MGKSATPAINSTPQLRPSDYLPHTTQAQLGREARALETKMYGLIPIHLVCHD